jgi:uncharacterized membrane protein
METSAEAQLSELKPGRIERPAARISKPWGLAFSAVPVVWGWAAFVRGRGFGFWLQVALVVAIAGLVVLLLYLTRAVAFRGVQVRRGEHTRLLAFSCSAFLLLAVFLPEYWFGKPPLLLRSLILLTLSLLLFAANSAVSMDLRLSRRSLPKPELTLLVFCLVYFVASTYVTLAKLHAFGYIGQDVAYFSQCLYTTLHGRLFYSNMYHDLLYGKPVGSDFAGHNQLVLLAFLPFYAIHKAASTMLVVRNVFIVSCAWPVYLIGRRLLSPWMAATAAMAFLLLPAVLYQNFYDFAPLSTAGLPLLFALYYFLEGKFRPYLAALACAQIVREDLVFAVFGLGLFALWQRRGLRWTAIPCMFALLWAVFSWKALFPYFLQGATSAVTGCFSYLGATPAEMVRNIAHHPNVLFSHDNLVYVKQMVDSFGVLFLFNPAWIISTPYIAINLAGEGGGCNTAMIYRHYALIPTVFLFGSFLLAVPKVRDAMKRMGKDPDAVLAAIVLFVLMAAVGSTAFVTGRQQFDDLRNRPWHKEARQVAAMLPSDAAVAVPRYLLPAVDNRMSLYQSLRLLEYHHPDARFIVIDKDWQRMEATDQWRQNYDALRHLLESTPEYSVIYNSPDYVIYKLCDGCAPKLPHRDPGKGIRD